MVAGTASPIILFDGVCNLCNRAVRVVLKRDKPGRFRFAPMQSEPGRTLLRECGLPERGVDYIVLVDGGRCCTKSDAVIRIAARLSPSWRCWALFARLVPRVVRDFKYDLIARWRYRVFGKRPTCVVPTPDVADRFL